MNFIHTITDKPGERFAVASVHTWLCFFVSIVFSTLLGIAPHNPVVLSFGIVSIALFCVTSVLAIMAPTGEKTPQQEQHHGYEAIRKPDER